MRGRGDSWARYQDFERLIQKAGMELEGKQFTRENRQMVETDRQ